MIAIIPSSSPRLMLLSSAVLCSATRHRTLLNSGTLVLVHLIAMGSGFLPRNPIVGRGFLKTSCGCCRNQQSDYEGLVSYGGVSHPILTASRYHLSPSPRCTTGLATEEGISSTLTVT